MALVAAGLTTGLVLGLLRGGSLRPLTRLKLRWAVPAAIALAALTATRMGVVGDAGVMLAAALLMLATTALMNRHLAGMCVVAVGVLANAAPIVINGGTPVEPRALAAVGVSPGEASDHLSPTQHLVTDRTLLSPLASQIPLPLGPMVVSFGDLIIAMGVASATCHAMGRRRRSPGGIPVAEILASGPLTLADDEPIDHSTPEPAIQGHAVSSVSPRWSRERTVEVAAGEPVPVPLGWERPDDASRRRPTRKRPRPTGTHPTMRLTHR